MSLKGKHEETEKKEEIKENIQDFWRGIIQRTEEDTTVRATYSEQHNTTEEILTKEVARAIKKKKKI